MKMEPAEARLRAAIARENAQARADRRQALEEHRAKLQAPASATGWSTKAERPKRRKGSAAAELERRREDIRLAWAARHPQAAKAERQLRKSRAQMLKRWDNRPDGTPETHEHASRRNQGALSRLWKSGAIDGEQLAAAAEIAAVHERIGADVAVKTMSLETRVDRAFMGDAHFYEALGQVRREAAYTRWRAEVRGPIGAVLEMIVGDAGEPIGFTIVAKRYRMHNRKAKQLLIDALDLWWKIHRDVRQEIDPATLAAAHAGIL